jgi:Family of unknown function (DUF5681)
MPFPNKATQFKPGNCANPGGRPKGPSLTSRLRELLDKREIDGKPIKNNKQVADLVAEVIVEKALAGDYRFVDLMMNRIEGKVPDTVKLDTDDTTSRVRDYLLGKTHAPDTDG